MALSSAANDMVTLRSTLFFICFGLTCGLFGSVVVLTSPITPLPWRLHLLSLWARANAQLFHRICGLSYRVEGLENLPEPPYLIISNHQSTWETLVFNAIMTPAAWVQKRSLAHIPFFGWSMRVTGQIFIDRNQPLQSARQVLKGSRTLFNNNCSLILCPEGTRADAGEVGPFKVGGVAAAMSARIPLVPVGHDSGFYWPRHTLRIHPGEITIRIGRPLSTEGIARSQGKKMAQQVRDEVITLATKER